VSAVVVFRPSGFVRAFGDSEVEDLDVSLARDEDVVGLHVPMDDSLVVGGAERRGDLETVFDGPSDRNAGPVEALAESLALEELGDGVGHAVFDAEVVDREDVRMGQRGDGAGPRVALINFEDPERARHKVPFDNLTPLYPDKRLSMSP
jgi:hypothetical protein